MARALIVGGEDRGLLLAELLIAEGWRARVVVTAPGRGEVERLGAGCWIGEPDRPAQLRYAMEQVAVACWLFGSARGPDGYVRALHGSLLERFLELTIDSGVRGVAYEVAGSVPADALDTGRALAARITAANSIPLALISADPADRASWAQQATSAVVSLCLGASADRAAAIVAGGFRSDQVR